MRFSAHNVLTLPVAEGDVATCTSNNALPDMQQGACMLSFDPEKGVACLFDTDTLKLGPPVQLRPLHLD
jgi:hypothetical protein